MLLNKKIVFKKFNTNLQGSLNTSNYTMYTFPDSNDDLYTLGCSILMSENIQELTNEKLGNL